MTGYHLDDLGLKKLSPKVRIRLSLPWTISDSNVGVVFWMMNLSTGMKFRSQSFIIKSSIGFRSTWAFIFYSIGFWSVIFVLSTTSCWSSSFSLSFYYILVSFFCFSSFLFSLTFSYNFLSSDWPLFMFDKFYWMI